jgi:hypothetical protein
MQEGLEKEVLSLGTLACRPLVNKPLGIKEPLRIRTN